MRKKIARLTSSLMQALEMPISIFPFWCRKVRSRRNLYGPLFQPWREDDLFRSDWKDV